MNRQENEKKVSSFPVRTNRIVAIICALVALSAAMAYAAGYSIADFVTPWETRESSGGGRYRNSHAIHFSDGKVVDLSRLGGAYGAYAVNRFGYAPGYSSSVDHSNRHAVDVGDDVVKNPGVPAGTYGDTGGVNRAVLFDNDNMSDFNSRFDTTPGWNPNLATSGNYFYYVPGWPIYIIGPPSGPGTGTGPGTGSTPIPIPAALPLFGSGLALLWLLHGTREKKSDCMDSQ